MNAAAAGFFDNLIPPPRVVAASGGVRAAPRRVRLGWEIQSSADEAALHDLASSVLGPWLEARGGPTLEVRVRLVPSWRVEPRACRGDAERAESYALILGARAELCAPALAGLQRGLQTLRQILENAAAQGSLPPVTIRDWPRTAHRGIHLDLAREMEYRPRFLERVIENLAYLKLNTLHLYLENKFRFPSAPEVAPPAVMTPAQARALGAYARRFGITVIPQLATLGHMEHLLHGGLRRHDPAPGAAGVRGSPRQRDQPLLARRAAVPPGAPLDRGDP